MVPLLWGNRKVNNKLIDLGRIGCEFPDGRSYERDDQLGTVLHYVYGVIQ